MTDDFITKWHGHNVSWWINLHCGRSKEFFDDFEKYLKSLFPIYELCEYVTHYDRCSMRACLKNTEGKYMSIYYSLHRANKIDCYTSEYFEGIELEKLKRKNSHNGERQFFSIATLKPSVEYFFSCNKWNPYELQEYIQNPSVIATEEQLILV